MKNTVLFIEWSTSGRDFEIDLPLMYFFERYLNWEVQYVSIFNLPKILNINPDIIIMSNTTGAVVNFEILKLAKQSNFLFFSHISEGVIRHADFDWAYWGWNKDKILYEDMNIIWNLHLYKNIEKNDKYILDKIGISGSVGHDKYKILQLKYNSLQNLINKYKKVVCYTGYDFVNMSKQAERFSEMIGKEAYEKDQKNADLVNKILRELIKNNLDILFILKPHPGERDNIPRDTFGLTEFKNTIEIKGKSIVDVIAISDILLNYRSSTNLETWLFDKPSISLCTDDELLKGVPSTYGSITTINIGLIQNYIDEYYKTGKIKDFENKREIRDSIVKDTILFSDGLNHVRFMSFLKPYIKKVENGEIQKGKWNISLKEKIRAYIKHIIYTLSKGKYNIPFLKRWANIYDIFEEKEIKEQKNLRYSDFSKFHTKNKDKIDKLYVNWHKNWKQELGIKE